MVVNRPKDEEELQKREAIGVIRASRFIRKYAQSHQDISVDVICKIHKEIFKSAWPEIAGVFRIEDLVISDSELILPHYIEVPGLMKMLNDDLATKLKDLKECEGYVISLAHEVTDEGIECIEKIIHLTSWLHHRITIIHPFRDGNGRTARLAANFILERYGLVGISVKLEKENKNQYRKALEQIDKYEDYEPLESIITEGIMERYDGVSMKYYEY